MRSCETKRRRWEVLLGSVLALLLVSSPSLWGDSSATVQVSWRVESTQTLYVLGPDGRAKGGGTSVSSTFVIPNPTPEDLERGYVERQGAVTLVARSNTPWVISVRTEDLDMGTSFDGTVTKPITDFQVRANGQGRYLTVQRYDQALAEGPPGEHRVAVDYRVLFDRERHRDGDYRITLVYTISTR